MSKSGAAKSRTILIFLSVLGVFAYIQGVTGPWLYDDGPNLTANQLLHIDGLVADDWRTAALSSGSGILRRPVSMFTFAVEHAWWGEMAPLTAKAGNVVLHFLNAIFVLVLCRLLLQAPLGPGLRQDQVMLVSSAAALIWLLHPLHVSTVLYAVQRMAQLSALFVLIGLCVFLRVRLRWAEAGAGVGEVIASVMWLLLLFALAVLSKENGALLPWLVVVLEVCFFSGRWNGRCYPWLTKLAWALLLIPAISLVCLYVLSPDWLIRGYITRDFSLDERLMTQSRLLWQYLGWFFWPDVTNMGIHHDDIPLSLSLLQPVTTLLSLLAWILVFGVAVVMRHRSPLLLFAVLFYLVAHSMESGILPLMMVFEHRNYLPSVGVCVLLGGLLTLPFLKGDKAHPVLPTIAFSSLLLVFLFIRASLWGDESQLIYRSAVNHPESSRSQYVYANMLLGQYQDQIEKENGRRQDFGPLAEARYHFEQAVQLAPHDPAVLVTLYQLDSHYFQSLGKRDQWMRQLQETLDTRYIRPSYVNALKSLMKCLAKESCYGGRDVAFSIIDGLREKYPTRVDITLLEHMYLTESGSPYEERIEVLNRALQSRPLDQRLLYRLLGEAVQVKDMGLAYEAGRRIMLSDPSRWQLGALKQLFPKVVVLKYE